MKLLVCFHGKGIHYNSFLQKNIYIRHIENFKLCEIHLTLQLGKPKDEFIWQQKPTLISLLNLLFIVSPLLLVCSKFLLHLFDSSLGLL